MSIREAQEQVRQFREACGLPCGDEREPHVRNGDLHVRLLAEELGELAQAVDWEDENDAADALADIIVIALGAACDFGLDMGPIWDAVQGSNMAKVGADSSPTGKLSKPPGWKPPDIAGCLARQRRKPCRCARCCNGLTGCLFDGEGL